MYPQTGIKKKKQDKHEKQEIKQQAQALANQYLALIADKLKFNH